MSHYRYLGVYFDESLKFDRHMEHIMTRSERGIKMIKLLLWKGMEAWQLIYSWLTYVAPLYRYGALIWLPRWKDNSWSWMSHQKKFVTKFNSTVKLALKLTPKTDTKLLNNFLGTYSVENVVKRNYYTNAKKLLSEYAGEGRGVINDAVYAEILKNKDHI